MMIKLIFILGITFSVPTQTIESIYSKSITTIEGVDKPISAYQGKKMLIITLPIVQSAAADSLLTALDSIANVHTSDMVIIATPSKEDGFTTSNKASLKQWYRSKLRMSILVTDGYFTRKTAGNNQHALFQFLTKQEKNGSFNNDVEGVATKFVVWTDGELIGFINPQTKVNGRSMKSLID